MAQAWGTTWPTARMAGPTTSRGYMQPPSSPHTIPRTTATEMACSSVRERMLTSAAAPEYASDSVARTRKTAAGLPQWTPKMRRPTTSSPTHCTTATHKLVASSAATTVRRRTGAAARRRMIPIRRVSTTPDARSRTVIPRNRTRSAGAT